MTVPQIQDRLKHYYDQGLKLFTTSSFQSHSVPLLHIIAQTGLPIPVVFLNTGFHFPDTVRFKDQVAALLGLDILEVLSPVPRDQQRDVEGRLFFTSDPDHCCYLNKTLPMDPVLQSHDIWINGVRRDQNFNRSQMQVEAPAPHDVTRFHPILDWSGKMIYAYIKEHSLPRHPLDDKGYVSIGCEPCTRRVLPGDERGGRWFGMTKTECGLHTELMENR